MVRKPARASGSADPLDRLKGRSVVIDLATPFVVLGTLSGLNHRYLELRDADVHDLRDAQATREFYVVQSKTTGVKVNRKHVLIPRDQVVSVALLDDVVS